jgi:hypothetical protein
MNENIEYDWHMVRGEKYHIAIKDNFYIAYGLTKEEAYDRLQEKIRVHEENKL